jgi:uncharacterized protein with beta-barrel porin domain
MMTRFFLCTASLCYISAASAYASNAQPGQLNALSLSQQSNAIKVRDTLLIRLNRELDAMHCTQDESSSCFVDARQIHVYATGFGNNLHQGKVAQYGYGFQSNTGGFSTGADYHFSDVMYAGVLGAYTSSDIKWTSSLGERGYHHRICWAVPVGVEQNILWDPRCDWGMERLQHN